MILSTVRNVFTMNILVLLEPNVLVIHVLSAKVVPNNTVPHTNPVPHTNTN